MTNYTTPKLDLMFRNIDKEYMNLWYRLWWRYMPGVIVVVKWPRGWTKPDHLGNSVDSADPNDHYRPELERLVGRQGLHWDWQIDDIAKDTLKIKIIKSKAHLASYLAMKWA